MNFVSVALNLYTVFSDKIKRLNNEIEKIPVLRLSGSLTKFTCICKVRQPIWTRLT